MTAVVIDTNVIAAANEFAEQACPDCVLACIDALEQATKRQVVVIDAAGLCLEEYFTYANHSGQPRVGDYFAKWLRDHQWYHQRVEQVQLTPKNGLANDFEEFPDDPALRSFDPSDRKFVALAKMSRHKPTVLNATDTDWWHHRESLARNDIDIAFLCPELMMVR